MSDDGYSALTDRGKLRRLRHLAEKALARYHIDVEELSYYAYGTNLLYRVRSKTGERYMLRMASPGWRTLDNLRAEAMWLSALDVDTDIGAPAAVRARDGEQVLPVTGEGVPHSWNATLMTWVEGRLLERYLSSVNLWKMGELFAKLHIHGASWKRPEGFPGDRFDAFLSRGEPNVLFAPETLAKLDDDDVRVLGKVRGWVEREYSLLDPGDLRVIHCDLWHENIRLHRGRLRPFDFEDTILGYRLHDMAMGLLDLLETVGYERYVDLLAAFREGYESLLAWPEGNMEVLQIGRMLWILNWVARFQGEHIGSAVEMHAKTFRRYCDTGVLRMSGGAG